MTPKNLPADAEAPETVLEQAAPVTEPAPVILGEDPKPVSKPLLTYISIGIAVLAVAYAGFLQLKLMKVQVGLQQALVGMQAANLGVGKAQRTADDATIKLAEESTHINQVETRMDGKFKTYDEYVTKTIPSQLKQIPQMEAELSTTSKQLNDTVALLAKQVKTNSVTVTETAGKQKILIDVVKNQDSILRTLFPATNVPTPK